MRRFRRTAIAIVMMVSTLVPTLTLTGADAAGVCVSVLSEGTKCKVNTQPGQVAWSYKITSPGLQSRWAVLAIDWANDVQYQVACSCTNDPPAGSGSLHFTVPVQWILEPLVSNRSVMIGRLTATNV